MSHLDLTQRLYRFYPLPAVEGPPTQLSMRLFSITGYHTWDYLPPVRSGSGDIVNVASDESCIKQHYASSLVVAPHMTPEAFTSYEERLGELIAQFSLPHIHFTEILGRTRACGNRLDEFLDRYVCIVAEVPLLALALSRSHDVLAKTFSPESLTQDAIYHSLHWNNMKRLLPALRPHSILHMLREVENNITGQEGLRQFDRLYAGIDHIPELVTKNISICRVPLIFTKHSLFYSSLSDLVAYVANVLQHARDSGVPTKKLVRRYARHIDTVRGAFQNHSGIDLT